MPQDAAVATRRRRLRRALEVTGVARRTKLLSVLREVGVGGGGEATQERAEAFRTALEELGTTFIKLGQLLSSRPDLLPDVYVQELGRSESRRPTWGSSSGSFARSRTVSARR